MVMVNMEWRASLGELLYEDPSTPFIYRRTQTMTQAGRKQGTVVKLFFMGKTHGDGGLRRSPGQHGRRRIKEQEIDLGFLESR